MRFFVILDNDHKRVINVFNREDIKYSPTEENIKEVDEKLFSDLLQSIIIPDSITYLESDNIIKVVSKPKEQKRFLASYFDIPEFRLLTGLNVINSGSDYNHDLYVEISEEVYNFIKDHMFEANSSGIKVDKTLSPIESVDQINVPDMKMTKEDKFEAEKHMIIEKKYGDLFHQVTDKTLLNFFNFIVRNNELMSHGIVITDENRDEQYLKILRDAASDDEKVKLAAEKNIDILSDYLEAYDSLVEHFSVHKKFNQFRKEILECENHDQIEDVIKGYERKVFSVRR